MPTEEAGPSRIKTALRWMAVLPAAAVGFFIFQVIFILVGRFYFERPEWADQLITSGIGPAGMLYGAMRTAPAAKKVVGLTLGILYGIVTVIGIATAWHRNHEPIWTTVCGLVGLFAMWAVLVTPTDDFA